MIKTILTAIATFAIIAALSFVDIYYVNSTFDIFSTMLDSLYEKTEMGTANYEDGVAVQTFWEEKKKRLHIWTPHNAIYEIDYQLYEALGYLYLNDCEGALPKIQILLGMCENVPESFMFGLENVF